MDFQIVIGTVVGLMFVGGIGWRLNAELAKIRLLIETFMATANQKWSQIDKMEAAAEKLEGQVNRNTASIAVIQNTCTKHRLNG